MKRKKEWQQLLNMHSLEDHFIIIMYISLADTFIQRYLEL